MEIKWNGLKMDPAMNDNTNPISQHAAYVVSAWNAKVLFLL